MLYRERAKHRPLRSTPQTLHYRSDVGTAQTRHAANFAVWGSVVPNLGWSNIAREIWRDAKLHPRVPAYSVVLAGASSLTAAMSRAAC